MSFSGLKQTGYRDITNDVIMVDSGAIYFSNADKEIDSLVESDFSLFGALQGGSTFEVDTSYRDIDIDGIKGSAKGAKIKDEVSVMISGDLMEHTLENYLKALPGAYTSDWPDSDPTHDLIERDCNLALEDYVNYVALVGYLGEDCSVGTADEPFIFMLKNALNQSTVSIELADEAEGLIPVEFHGHYDPDNPDTEPWAIAHPKDVTTPRLATSDELVEGTTNPNLTFELLYDSFTSEVEAEDTTNWTFTDDVDGDGSTGLTLGTIYYHDDQSVTIELDSTGATDGTTDTGSISIQADAAALDGGEATEALKISTVS